MRQIDGDHRTPAGHIDRTKDKLGQWGREARAGIVCSCGKNACKTCEYLDKKGVE